MAFTLVATDADVAVLDAIQYAFGGPCVEAPRAEQVLQYDADSPVDERRWQSFAQTTGVKAVAATLTLPILLDGKVVGAVNLYAASVARSAGFTSSWRGSWARGRRRHRQRRPLLPHPPGR